MHFDVVLDIGFDYGADGGLSWDTQVIHFPNGRARRNMRRSVPLGAWQLGNRDIDAATLDTLQGFLHAMRGRAHSFLYKDWNDYRASDEALVLDGSDESQLIKTYGASINSWVRNIVKPNADTVVISYNSGSGFAALTVDVDYTLDAVTGIVTWLLDPLPDTSDAMRWSGEFWVPVRFDRDVLSAQFLGFERRASGDELAYSIGALSVVEES
jgi:uncharacterized protein (TIGR02217 family)